MAMKSEATKIQPTSPREQSRMTHHCQLDSCPYLFQIHVMR